MFEALSQTFAIGQDGDQRLAALALFGERPIAGLPGAVDAQRQVGELALAGVESGRTQRRQQFVSDLPRQWSFEMGVEPEPRRALVRRRQEVHAHESAGTRHSVDGVWQILPARGVVGDELLDVPDELALAARVGRPALAASGRRQRLPAEAAVRGRQRFDNREALPVTPPDESGDRQRQRAEQRQWQRSESRRHPNRRRLDGVDASGPELVDRLVGQLGVASRGYRRRQRHARGFVPYIDEEGMVAVAAKSPK